MIEGEQIKNDRIYSILSMRVFQTVFFGLTLFTLYSIFTLNYNILLSLSFLTLICIPYHGKSQKYINLVKNTLKTIKFFKVDRIYEEQIPQQQLTLFSFHPHSVFSYGFMVNMHLYDDPKDKISNMIGLGSRFALNTPIFGYHFKFWGIQPINPSHIKSLMQKKKTIGMLPGGFEEATITTPKELRIFIQNRKGFIKYALKYGYTIRPIIILKEHQFYNTFDYFTKFRLFLNRLKMPGVLFFSKFGPYLPNNPQIITVIGKGIKSQNKYQAVYEPTNQQIQKVHHQYKEEILRIYQKNKHLNGNVPIKLF